MEKDIKFFDTLALLKSKESELIEEDKILISVTTFEKYKDSFPFLWNYVDKYEVIDCGVAHSEELEDAIFANDNLYIDEVLFVTGSKKNEEFAEKYFGDAMIQLI